MLVGFLLSLSLINAGLINPLDDQILSNADDACADLANEEKCVKAGPCIWGGSSCAKDPCFSRTLTVSGDCPNIAGPPALECVHVPKVVDSGTPTNSHFCVDKTRLNSFKTKDQICRLEWGGWKLVELAACKTLSTQDYGCGPVESIEGKDDSHYVCKAGAVPNDPCAAITDENLCTYVGECMYDNTVVGTGVVGCVADECWEKTYTSADQCKTNIPSVTCSKHILNPTGSPQYGYCKTNGTGTGGTDHDLHSPCNVGTATNFATKQVVCSWAGTGIPSDCNKVATIDNYDGGTLYVCNPVGEEFDVGAASSLKSLAVAISTALLLIMIL